MAYSSFDNKNQYGNSVTNYTNKDFNSIKQNLINHVKSYFPQVYKDFNETSPGMMLVELSAYVGDVLSYYIDDSFKELLLPLSEDRRNVINLSKVTGYKPKPIVPSFVDLSFTLIVDADTSDINNIKPLNSQKLTLDKGIVVSATSNPEQLFETLEPIDFSVDKNDSEKFVINEVDTDTGLASTFKAIRTVRAVSGETKTASFTIGPPEQYKKITMPDLNIIEILSVVDSNGNNWYEVDYLAQENIALSTFYAQDESRTSSEESSTDGTTIVPSSLSFVKSSKRFTKEVNEDNTTSLIFGNGILKNGNSFETTFLNIEQEGVNLPTTVFTPQPLDATMGQYYASLGEAPQNVTLTITYRAGGGVSSNLPASDLVSINSVTTIPAGSSTANLSVTNDLPAVGGKEGDFTEEIRQGALANYSTQNRCVTKEDFEARVISMPSRFGSVAKVYCSTGGTIQLNNNAEIVTELKDIFFIIMNKILNTGDASDRTSIELLNSIDLNDGQLINLLSADGQNITQQDRDNILNKFSLIESYTGTTNYNPTIDLFILSYDVNRNLMSAPDLIKRNIKNYLTQFRLLTDKIRILDGYVINFGVLFDIISYPGFDKSVLKTKCIEAIKEIYSVPAMQFKQILYTADVINVLNGIEGVKAVNDVIFTQDRNFLDNTDIFTTPLFSKSINEDGEVISINDLGYGYLYNFEQFFNSQTAPQGRGVVLPSFDPSVFEIKNPNTDIKGVVR